MKIGILSMQKIPNYGSFLQALSLKIQMEARGHDVYFIDIQKGRQIVSPPNTVSLSELAGKLDNYVLKRIENVIFSRKMSRIHISDYVKYLETEKQLTKGERFDLVIIGSDEVFNATAPSPWGFSPQLFGKIENADKVVSYAASCGRTNFADAQKYGIDGEIADALSNLDAISVRDKNTYDFVKSITGKDALMHLDPVFVSDYDDRICEKKRKKQYLLVYAYVNRINDDEEITAIKDYAKAHNLDIVSVGTQQRWCSHNIAANAFELLSYVKNAACIVTDTFHGTVFSIKYNKQFVTLIRESNRNKLGGLLSTFDLMSRSVDSPEHLAEIMDKEIDFENANAIIATGREFTYKYFDEICKEG